MGQHAMSVASLMRVTRRLENHPELALRFADIIESTRNRASIKRRCVYRPPNRITKLEPIVGIEKGLQF